MAWIKNNEQISDFNGYVRVRTGKTPAEIVADRKPEKVYRTKNLDRIAGRLFAAKKEDRLVAGVFDYDADGLTSAAEMHILFDRLGIRHTITIPKRITDGYGINLSMIGRIPEGSVLITVDNGIAAIEPVMAAKAKGMEVLIMDHHNAPIKPGADIEKKIRDNGGVIRPEWLDLPDADIIADPEAPLPDGWDYTHYCGAGLVYKLAEIMIPDDLETLNTLCSLAAIATIADSVDVTGENGRIIEQGLSCINKGTGLEGLEAVLGLLQKPGNINPVTTESVGYYLAPMINAPGRLDDNGGEFVLKCLFSKGDKAKENAKRLKEINEKRKAIVEECMENAEILGERVAFVYDETVPEGVCGIIAGRLAEKYHKPAFVMTMTDSGKVKGSSRAPEGANVLTLLRAAGDALTGFGGHDQAAGFSLTLDKTPLFLQRLEENADEPVAEETEYYDFEIMPMELMKLYQAQNRVGIFGQGLEVPVVKMRVMAMDVRGIGKDQAHLSFKACEMKCIGFELMEKYKELGSPDFMTVYGTVGINWFHGVPNPQFMVTDIEKQE